MQQFPIALKLSNAPAKISSIAHLAFFQLAKELKSPFVAGSIYPRHDHCLAFHSSTSHTLHLQHTAIKHSFNDSNTNKFQFNWPWYMDILWITFLLATPAQALIYWSRLKYDNARYFPKNKWLQAESPGLWCVKT